MSAGIFSRVVGYHIVSSARAVGPGMGILCAETSWVSRPVFQSVGIVPRIYIFQNMSSGCEVKDMINYGQGSSLQHLLELVFFATFSITSPIITHMAPPFCLPSACSNSQSQVDITSSRLTTWQQSFACCMISKLKGELFTEVTKYFIVCAKWPEMKAVWGVQMGGGKRLKTQWSKE